MFNIEGKMPRDKMSEKYDEFTNLLLIFLEHGYHEDKKDIDAICEYISKFDNEDVKKCLEEMQGILVMEPFPAQWIEDTTNALPFDEGLDPTPENYRAWVEWMVKALEEEARNAGKF